MVQELAEEMIGREGRIKKPWFNKVCEDAIQRRKIARNIWLCDTENLDRHNTRLDFPLSK